MSMTKIENKYGEKKVLEAVLQMLKCCRSGMEHCEIPEEQKPIILEILFEMETEIQTDYDEHFKNETPASHGFHD